MKIKIAIFSLIFFACTTTLFAQQHSRPIEDRVKFMVGRMTDSLSLDKTQAEKASVVMTDFYMNIDKLREGLAPGVRPERSEMEKLLKLRDEKLSQFFTEGQMKRLKEMEHNGARPMPRQ